MAAYRMAWKLLFAGPFAAIPSAAVISQMPPKHETLPHSCCRDKKLLKATELPIYDEPACEHEAVERSPTALEESIGVARRTVVHYFSAVENVKERTLRVFETATAHSKTTYDFLTDDANTIPRALAITAGGLGGLLLGARGGIVKKVMYPGVGLTVVASLLYPKLAVELATTGYQRMRNEGPDKIKEITGYDIKDIFKVSESSMPTIFKKRGPGEIGQQAEDKKSSLHLAAGDAGQSNPADKDMYTTRGS